MKKIKYLSLIPVLLGVCACSFGSKSSTETDTDESSDDPFVNPGVRAGEVEKGAEHPLPWNINYELLKSENGALDYASYHKTYVFDGTNVYCYGLRAVTDISVNVNGSLIAYGGFKIIHFAKVGHEKFPDGGQIQISDIKPTRAVFQIVSHSRYTYSSTSAPTLYVGDRVIRAPATADSKTVSPIHEEFNIYSVTYEINATEAGVVKIKSDQSFSMYIQSMQFE